MLELASVWTIFGDYHFVASPHRFLGPIVCVFLFPWIPLSMSF